MTRWMWLALWASIQLFFITSLGTVLIRVQQIYRIVSRHEASCRRSVKEVQQIEASISNGDHP